ncbi:MAG: hypothetical protein F2954_00675 [Actinobacteria bacterium]|nr:hypothetical protein [Actinomycetota bacterium]
MSVPIIIFSLIALQPAVAIESLTRISIDPLIPQKAPLVKCITENQLDCIERVLVEHPSSLVEEAQYVATRLVDFPDENNQKVQYGDILFDFHSATSSGTIKRLRISTHVITPVGVFNGKKAGAYWLILQRELLPGEVGQIPSTSICTPTNPTPCLSYPALDSPDIFHVYLRTSWLKPVSASGEGKNFNIDYRNISGGMQWHFSGQEFLQPMFSDVTKLPESVKPGNENMVPDRLNPTLYFALDHGGKDLSDSYWDPGCMSHGFTRTMWNAPLAGQLVWDYSKSSLNFNMYAPHLDPFGNVYLGVFRAKFQKAWLDCRFPGNTLSTATKLTVEVLDQNGTAQVSTSSISMKNEIIDISVTGFHFSSPVIVVKRSKDSGTTTVSKSPLSDDWENDVSITKNSPPLSAPTPLAKPTKTPSPNPTAVQIIDKVASKKTILCSKGKLVKKITSLYPKCPSGYKMKG